MKSIRANEGNLDAFSHKTVGVGQGKDVSVPPTDENQTPLGLTSYHSGLQRSMRSAKLTRRKLLHVSFERSYRPQNLAVKDPAKDLANQDNPFFPAEGGLA